MPIQTPATARERANCPQPLLALGCLLAALTLPVHSYAADNPGVHEHGHARLQIAVENNSIDLMLASPAYNLAGFEHEARTDEEKNRLSEINQWLNNTPLVNTEAAGCRVNAAAVELGGEGQKEDHGHHDEHHHDHDDHTGETSHREYDVSQQLECDDLGASLTLTSALMEKFENLEELAVEWVSPSGQGSARLNSSNRAFTINE
ncbi:MAG: DUF2796 domain-containing protein [Marinobacter sp.]|uniref:ZrgA family zinc uptake protein n=1 Tax=Marinobacter sp. TaxID=50741 RepID=UPI003976243B